MKHLAPACFRAFVCAAGSCPDSCCRAGWEIVPDPETLALYDRLPGPEGERIRAGIVPGGEALLRQDENRVCVLLDPDGLCCVQRRFGHGALCRVCRDYPRFHREFGGLTEHGLSLSCPTAYALASAAPPAWEEWEDEAPPVLNELDPRAYLRLRDGRSAALELLASHDALHEVQSSIAEAQICLECEDRDDFLRTMSQTAQGLAHLRDEEALRLSNLY